MTTRPQSVRANHRRVARRSAFAGMASGALLLAGLAVVVLIGSWWAWVLLALGVAWVAAFFGLLPRYRAAREQLRHVERIHDEQTRAADAQRRAMERGLVTPQMRSPFASSA